MNSLKIASLQLAVYEDKYENIERLAALIADGASGDADIISLPEMWNCPYRGSAFPEYAEPAYGDSWLALSTIARKNSKYIVGGTIVEQDENGKIYNTSYIFDRDGRQIGKQRKVHLFELYSRGKTMFREGDVLSAGDSFDVFETEFGKMAVNICFDIRFPESARISALKGARVIFNPASFSMKTGPSHWELTFRQRAIENQVFMVGTATARRPESGYIGYGHSIITDPWGKVLMQMDEKEGSSITEIELDYIDEVKEELPLMRSRREDVYEIREV